MRKLLLLPALSLLCSTTTFLYAQKAPTDPLTIFLNGKGFSNIPYTKQNQAKVGGIVAAAWSGKGVPVFERPPDHVPTADPNPGIVMPGETIASIQSAGLGLTVFGFNIGADFNHPETLSYTTTTLTGAQLDISQVRGLLQDPQVIKTLDIYKGDLSRWAKAQEFTADIYIISGVFYSTGVDITTSNGSQASLKVNGTVPACQAVPTPTPATTTNQPAAAAPAAPAAGRPAAAAPAATDKPAQGVSGAVAGAATSVAGAADAVSNAATKVADTAQTVVATATAGVPGGSGYYCRTVTGAIHFTSERPIPVALEVYTPYWDGKEYKATPAHPVPILPNN